MNRRYGLILAVALLSSPIWASNPGEPLDCSDWVFMEPGLACEEVLSYPCPVGSFTDATPCIASQDIKSFDNEGNILAVREVDTGSSCGSRALKRLELVRFRNGSEEVLGYLGSRCANLPTSRVDVVEVVNLAGYFRERHQGFPRTVVLFDPTNGHLLVTTGVFCTGGQQGECPYVGDCNSGGCLPPLRVFRITGFATTFEILQTYTPSANELSFRVPYMPEGFQFADYFDTYYGDLASVGDWSQAQSLQCGYPASPPNVGDYLTVTDTLPTPTPGQGYYYVTAVNYQGQRRYGRKSSGGVLTGRDPAVLPGCE